MNKRVARALGMHKQAGWGESIALGLRGIFGAGSDVIQTSSIGLLAAIAAAGGAAGMGAAKMLRKGKSDADLAGKEYMDARLSADVVNLEQKLKSEVATANANTPKSMRLI